MNAVVQETPAQAARRLAAGPLREGFQPAALHEYQNTDASPAYWRIRLKHPDGRKWMRPMHWTGDGYTIGEPAPPVAGKLLYRLPELLAADPAALVWIVEGESCADALAKLGMVATTSGGSTSAEAADCTPLRGRRCVVWPDHDKPGAEYADTVSDRLRALGCVVDRVDVAALGLPDKGDCVDWLAMHPNATAADVHALPLVADESQTRTAPEPLPDPLPSVPQFDAALLPESVRAWCIDTADGLNVPLDFTAVPAMVALAGAIGRGIAVALRAHGRWFEYPILWGCVVGRPSSGKSPALNPARNMLEKLASIEAEAHAEAMKAHDAQALLAEVSRGTTKDAIRKALKAGDRDHAEALAAGVSGDSEAPPAPRIVVNDSSVEKLGEILNANPRGLVQFRDELAGWLASLDREGREGDRAFWLECWNGSGPYTSDRIGRGTIRVEACAASILGGMQPGKLAEYVRGAVRGGFSDDGLIQRFQLAVYPDMPKSWRYCDRAPQPQAEERAWETFRRLRNLDLNGIGAESADYCDTPFLRLDAEALELFVQWQTGMMNRLRAGDEPAWMESHLAKYPALVGRLALVLHLADNGRGPITADTLARALDWCGYLEGHARRMYAPAIDGGLSAAHVLLRKRKELADGFTARDVYRKGWGGLATPEAVADALAVLAEYRHLRECRTDTGGRPTISYAWRGAA